MIEVGKFNTLKVLRAVDFGVYLDDGAEGILLPKRFAPRNVEIGDEIEDLSSLGVVVVENEMD